MTITKQFEHEREAMTLSEIKKKEKKWYVSMNETKRK